MALRAHLTKAEWEKLDEGLRGLYSEKDGDYSLEVDGLEDVAGLKNTLATLRNENKAFEKAIKAWKGFGKTPEEIQNILDELETERQKNLASKGDWEKLRDDLVAKHQKELAERDTLIQQKNDAIEKYIIDSAVKDAITKNNGKVKLLLPHVKARCRVEQGDDGSYAIQVMKPDGSQPMIDSAGKNISVEAFVGQLREDADFQSAFNASGNSGSGGTGSNGGNNSGVIKLSRTDAQNQSKFDAAYERAEKEGLQLVLTD